MIRALSSVILFAATAIVSSLLALILANIPNLLDGGSLDSNLLLENPLALPGAMLFSYAVLFTLLVLFRLVRFPLWQKRTALPIRRLWLALLAMLILGTGLSMLIAPLNLEDPDTMAVFEQLARNPLGVLLLVLVGPFIEECVFREGILSALRAKQWHAWSAAVVSAVLFAAVHANLLQAIPAFAMGLLLAAFYIGTNDIRLPLAAHILNNALAAITLLFPEIDELESSMNPSVSYTIGAMLTLIGAVLGVLWWRTQRNYVLSKFMQKG